MVARDVKVGVFVLGSLLLIGLVVFLIGDEAQMFSKHTEMRAAFKDVGGLSRGSPVRMGGVDIGRVVSLGYGKQAEDDTIYVEMTVVAEEARRIRKDSVATVEGKGLLGDKMIVITVGSMSSPELEPGETVRTSESKDLVEMIGDLRSAVSGAERVINNLEKTTEAFADDELHKDIKQAVSHLNGILGALHEGDGFVGRLMRDPAEADRISKAIDGLGRSAGQLEKLLANTNTVVERVKTGPGFVHEVIYGQSGEKALAQVGAAAEEVSLALRGVRENESLAHNLLYDPQSGAMVDNLSQASADLRAIVQDVRAGKGTMGALLVDPSVYEDLKVLLGNVGRNRSLRALVRYSIRKDEQSGRVFDSDEGESGASSATAEAAAPAP